MSPRRKLLVAVGAPLGLLFVIVVIAAAVSTPTHSKTKPLSHAAAATPSVVPTTTPAENDEADPTSTAPVSTTGLSVGPPAARSACRSGDPLANVYHPYRLQVISKCSTVSGYVRSVRHEDDGDVHFDLQLDSAYRGMLNAGNVDYQHGWLVVEIVPADEPGCTVGQPPRPATGTYSYGVCTGADVVAPPLGEHVWVTGPYVIDHWHNWAEIHPAWQVTTSNPRPAPTPTTTQVAPPPTHAPTTQTLSCSAHMSNSTPADYTTTDVLVTTASDAAVTATAHYKSTDTTNTATADSTGHADIPFRISRATPGYTVVVDVQVTKNGASASCSTSFTPHS